MSIRHFQRLFVSARSMSTIFKADIHSSQGNNFLPHKWMRRQQGRVTPLAGILFTTTSNKVQHFRTPIIWIGKCRRRLGRNEKNCPQWIQVRMGRSSLGHFNRGNSQTPNIRPSIIMRLLDNLRCNPKRTPHHRLSLINSIRQLGTHPKISQFDIPIIRQQYISTLDIPMANLLLVQVFQSEHNARARRPNAFLGHGKTSPSAGSLDQITDRSSIAEFHDNPHFPRVGSFLWGAYETFEISYNVGTVAFCENVDFAHHFIGFFVSWDDFDGDYGAAGFVAGAEDLAEGSFAEHFVELELGGAILGHGLCPLHDCAIIYGSQR
mmetsp:Transcript_2354/g.5014  ORF Transcript_2354/g.5014 Transcript_2354/m.5014 type:complete len:322 (-) Transcript_2354:92-1057(-)